MARMIDVAQEAGVSVATVSRVLNGANVRPEAEAAVRSAVDKLGYAPNRAARTLRRRTSDVVGLIVADIENPFFTTFARTVEDKAHEQGLSIVLCNSDEDPAKEARYLQVAIDSQMAGVIVFPASDSTDLRPLVQRGMAVVAVDRELPGEYPAVRFNNRELGAVATKHLADAGRTRIACVTGPSRLSTAEKRAEGWRDALGERGLVADDDLLIHADFRVEGGRHAAAQLLDPPHPPDAILVTNNLAGVGVLRELAARGDSDTIVGVIGELPFATLMSGQVQITPLPVGELAREAWVLLQRRMASAGDTTNTVIIDTPAPQVWE